MPITGSQSALMQCRVNVARVGATRVGYYTPRTVISINSVDKTTSIEFDSLEVVLNLNAEPDTCVFAMKPGATSPTVGHQVIVGVGSTTNRLFGGQVIRKRHRRSRKVDKLRVEVECTDWSRLLDRRLVTTYYASQSATDIARAIITTYTSGFTANAVVAGLDTIDFFPAATETVSQALTRLAGLIDGGWYIDPSTLDLHFFGSAGESGSRAATPPQALTDSITTLHAIAYDQDDRQRRTRTYAGTKGAQTKADVAVGQQAIPIEDGSEFNNSGGNALIDEYGLFQYGGTNTLTYGTTTSATAAIGATSISLTDPTQIVGVGFFPGWVLVGGRQYLYYTGGTAGTITGIPSSGAGSITSAIASGEAVVNVPFLSSVLDGSSTITRAIPSGTYIEPITTSNDTSAQTALAAVEGGDGIHEFYLQDRRFGIVNGATLGAADLAGFSTALEQLSWETEDVNARPGTLQVVTLTGTDTISTTLLITQVTCRGVAPTQHLRRFCDASTIRRRDAIDALEAGARS